MSFSDKYKKINKYIQKVEDHPNIINIEDEAFKNAGKWSKYFDNDNDIVLEIGTGLGNFFSDEVSSNPNKNFIGKEIRFKRLYVTAQKTISKGGKNFVLLKTMGQNISKVFADGELSLTYVFFPDPWAKKDRQKKHRLWSDKFISDLYSKTKSGGKVIFKTDHREYFDSTLKLIKDFGKWDISKLSYDYENETTDFDKKRLTEFEVIFRSKDIKINYIELVKKST